MSGQRTTQGSGSLFHPRPSEEDERRALHWLMDVRENGAPLERRFAASAIQTLACFEEDLKQLRDAWNAHMAKCPDPPNLPTWEEIHSWADAPSNTASAE